MNNGHRIVREDTYEEDMYDKEEGFKYTVNLEDYPSNMNIMRWSRQVIIIHYVLEKYFNNESPYNELLKYY